MKEFKVKNITFTLLENLKPGDKIIRTKDWGDFKVRKNGRYILKIGKDIIRVSKINREEAYKCVLDEKNKHLKN